MPSFLATALRRGLAVAGHHHDAQAFFVERPDRLRSAFFDRIGDTDQARGLAVDGHEHHRLPVGAKCLGAFEKVRGIHAEALHQRTIAQRDLAPVDASLDALAGHGVEVRSDGQLDSARLCALHDRGRERVFAAALERRGQA